MPGIADLPTRIGRYRIVRKLGSGGMGSVFLAEDTMLSRLVALKLPRHEKNPVILQRFLREAKLAAQLFHANLCPILDIGEHNGIPFFVMPFLQGQPLSASLGKRWPPGEAVELVAKVANAVAVLHQNGVVHRDLKPHNIMLKDGHEPVVMDFGLAMLVSGSQQKLTKLGMVMGTPGYMAPEQMLSDGSLVGPCSDIFSLGVILYELLTAELPTIDPALMLVEPCGAGLTQAPSALGAAVDEKLDAICLRALAANPRGRFATMLEFAQELQQFTANSVGARAGLVAPPPPKIAKTLIEPLPRTVSAETPAVGGGTPAATVVAVRRVASKPRPAGTPIVPQLLGRIKGRFGRLMLFASRIDSVTAAAVIAGAIGVMVVVLVITFALSSKRQRAVLESSSGERTAVSSAGSPSPSKNSGFASASSAGENSATSSASGSRNRESGPGSGSSQSTEVPNDTEVFDLGGGVLLVMKRIPAKGAKFWMGSPATELERNDHEQQHEVEFGHDYYLGEYHVRQKEYAAVVGKNPSWFSEDGGGAAAVKKVYTGNHPVEQVSWSEAKDFCDRLTAKFKDRGFTFRLPKEAEWEYACRAGDPKKATSPFYFRDGPSSSLSASQANFDGNFSYGVAKQSAYLERTTSCGAYPEGVNTLGLWDMHGNVWQWCEDYYDPGYYESSPRVDPVCDKESPSERTNRVCRGGSWWSSGYSCRSAQRYSFGQNARFKDVGFRVCCARDVVPPPGSGSVRASGSRRRTPPGDTEIFDLGGEVKLVLKRIPAKGKTFWMASPETEANREQNEEQHEVEFSHDYYLGEWKVTQAQYQAIAGKWVSWYSKGGGGAKSVDGMDTDDFPVERLDWKKAQDFCDKLTAKFKDRGCTFRLPTEAEWEFACRAGDDRKATLPFYPEVRTQRVVVEWAGEF